jgi:hypothetical protein
MIAKLLLVSAAAGGLFIAQPQAASAGADVDINIGSYSYYPVQYDAPDYPRRSYHYDDDYENDYDRMSCWEGRRIVRRSGYRDVRTLRCYGNIYRYSGYRRGRLWRISVDSDTGHIVRARPVRPYY